MTFYNAFSVCFPDSFREAASRFATVTAKARVGTDVDILIDLGGRVVKAAKRNIEVAISKLGYIHIRAVDCPLPNGDGLDRTAIVTLQPELTSELAFAAVGYEVADLRPDRTIVVAHFVNPQCWVFSGYLPALQKIAALVRERGEGKVFAVTERPAHLV